VRAVEARLSSGASRNSRADAVWIVTADHGGGFDAARARVHHGGRLNEDLLRVPLFVGPRDTFPRDA
jgi:hypothetical protein